VILRPLLGISIAVLLTACGLWGDMNDLRPVILKDITITAYPEKTSYFLGEEHIDLTGLEISAMYSNGSGKLIENYSYTGFDSATLGSKTIIIDYQGFTAEFTVTVAMTLFDVNNIVPYLAAMPDKGGAADNPAYLSMQIELGNMTDGRSGWRQILNAINEAKRYIDLDLSACTMNGTTFDPDNTVVIGKAYIVSLVLPDEAKSLEALRHDSLFNRTFYHFNTLLSVSGANIETINEGIFNYHTSLVSVSFPATVTIGDFAFYNCTNLSGVDIPAAAAIGDFSFYGCESLVNVSFPAVTKIAPLAFWKCTNLASVNIPAAKLIDECAFRDTGDTSLTIKLGATAPAIGENIFWECPPEKTVTVQIPFGAAGYDEEWQDQFSNVGGLHNINLVIITQ